jgi:hypothetical protein
LQIIITLQGSTKLDHTIFHFNKRLVNKFIKLWLYTFLTFFSLIILGVVSVSAQTNDEGLVGSSGDQNQEEVVTFSAAFFQRYQPNTALDMVRQVPGFQLDDGIRLRGFSRAAGNILINSRRPSAKQDAVSAILARIPASNVERIDLIRGQSSGIDLQGQSVIANIIMQDDAAAAIRWQTSIRRNFNNHKIGPDIGISFSDRWKNIDYNAGFSVKLNPRSYKGPENVFDSTGNLTEQRNEDFYRDSKNGAINLNASASLGQTLVRLNTKLAYAEQIALTTSLEETLTLAAIARDEFFGQDQSATDFEIGIDAERDLSRYLSGKAIFLFYDKTNNNDTDQRVVNAVSEETLFFRQGDTRTDTMESIGRLEFDWSGWLSHAVQGNFELAYNSVQGALVQTEDTGTGPVLVDIPGANTRVEEIRGDVLLQDTWSRGKLVVNYGLGLERSTITSKGEDEQQRRFFFIKPQGQLTYSHNQNQQLRLRIAREVAQLNFNDFISTSEFEDDDLALGNTELTPEKTWAAELSHERRFGELGVVTLTAFYHWITDLQDLLPLTDEFEVPGNIGDANRWGFEMESTIPLEWLRLTGAKLDVKARWQSSSVTDPVTGNNRVLSGKAGFGAMTAVPFRDESDEYEYVFDIAYRQDFNTVRMAWGWDIAQRDRRILFKVNELDIVDEGELEFNAFIETTRLGQIKARFEAQNIFNLAETRDRTIFIGTRNSSLSGVDRREIRYRTKGFRLFLILSGTF